jgi:tetratricopeptide (TPR) repeat protein
MYSLIAALLASLAMLLAVTAATKLTYAILPALFVLVGVYWVLARRHSKQVEALMAELQREIQQQRVANAIRMLKGAYPHANWVFMLRGQIDGQIGTLHYIQKEFDQALPLLEQAWVRHWVAKGMLAAHQFRRHKAEDAFKTLDAAIAASKKEPMLYGLKAYMQVKLKDRDGAIATLTAGKDKCPSSQPITANLMHVQNNEPLDMTTFGEQWWQFHLEKPSMKQQMAMAGVSNKPKGGKKAMYR